jgi:hypothetical protein
LHPITWCGVSFRATSGSGTISRILDRTNSAADSFDSGLISTSLNAPMKASPRPSCHRNSYSASRSSGPTSSADLSLAGRREPKAAGIWRFVARKDE